MEKADEFLMQEGLLYTKPKYGVVFVFYEPDCGIDRVKACQDLRSVVKKQWDLYGPTQFNIIAGFNPMVWEETMNAIENQWMSAAGSLEKRNPERNIIAGSEKFLNTGGFACIVCRCVENDLSSFQQKLDALESVFNQISRNYNLTIDKTICGAKDALSGLFADGLGNKSEAIDVQEAVSCKGGVNGYPGGSYMLQQKFRFSWDLLSQKNVMDLAKMIGRHKENTMVIGNNERTHLTRVHHIEPNLHSISNFRIHRISMPFNDDGEQKETVGGFGGASKESGYFYISFSKSQDYVKKLLQSMIGDRAGITRDSLIATTTCMGGAFYYLPAVEEFGAASAGALPMSDLLFDHWDVKPENNEYMFYNHKEYLNRMSNSRRATITGKENPENDPYHDPPTQRTLHLVKAMFENWEDTWFHPRKAEPLPHLSEISDDPSIMQQPLLVRQATAVKLALSAVYTTSKLNDTDTWKLAEFYGVTHDLFRINPHDILAGKMPVYGLGVGQLAVPYLQPDTEETLSDENIKAYSYKLNEVSGFGHVVPNYSKILNVGVSGFLKELDKLINLTIDETKKEYYATCRIAFEGIQEYILNYSRLAHHLAQQGKSMNVDYALSQEDVANLEDIGNRMQHLSIGSTDDLDGKPRNFLEAVQLLLSLHACLHLTSEPVSIGRLDVILEEYLTQEWDQYLQDKEKYQEIIDAFFIKIGEKVQLSRETRLDLYKVGTIAVPYRSDGRFPRGDLGNQWVQQLTIGGYSLDEKGMRIPPSQYRNEIAYMCLRASKRLPLNAPCVTLRVHGNVEERILQEASRSVLSGGAHPILNHDDRLIPALQHAGFNLQQAVSYSSDGCYEPIIPGKTEFSFCYVPLLKVLEMTINRGATISENGPAGMRGFCVSQEFRPKGSSDIKSIDDLKKQYAKHLRLQMNDALTFLLGSYGNIYNIYASQLLSSMIDGCMESGKDIYNGGAEVKLIGLMAIAFSNTVDSLYAIQELCFGDDSQISLEYLLRALHSDWGYNLQEPYHDQTDSEIHKHIEGFNMKLIREKALSLPKYGLQSSEDERDSKRLIQSSHYSLKQLAEWLSQEVVAAFKEVTKDPKWPLVSGILPNLESQYGRFHFALGSGTFEGYVGWGLGIAASADGRRKAQPIASDMSPTPTPQDVPYTVVKKEDVYKLLPYWDIDEVKVKYSNGCEVDLTIAEGTKEKDLIDFLRHYANNEKNLGGNILSLTCADQDTYCAAMKNPEKYDLVRVRTGGWTEFFISFYSPHQHQHLRRTRAIIGQSPDVVTKSTTDETLSWRELRRRERLERRKQRRELKKAAKNDEGNE